MALVKTQHPYAVVIALRLTRRPRAIDSTLGELFVVRVAGNVVTTTLAASNSCAAPAHPLGVMLGHEGCGA
jgi:carbonic anhydrase